jgi:hypothetical protein
MAQPLRPDECAYDAAASSDTALGRRPQPVTKNKALLVFYKMTASKVECHLQKTPNSNESFCIYKIAVIDCFECTYGEAVRTRWQWPISGTRACNPRNTLGNV